ncbi:MAG: RagB/SusD family nutrient uptake outer membrane protein [Carboxylicivirga sp.]|jgi:hypothetical protein|nr:RagB/SusD family nutrient uptake outer membrane protein [Carboxylicivirga sp.]
MKNFKYLLFLLVINIGCSDFLEESSDEYIKLNTIQDYKEFLAGETYQNKKNASIPQYLDILTDDVQQAYKASTLLSNDGTNEYYGYYTWSEEPEVTKIGGIKNDVYYNRAYHNILICNIVEDDLYTKFEESDGRNSLLAELSFVRAQNYFMLVNLYSKPYNKATAASDPGVPVNTSITIDDKKIARSTVQEVYNVINSNIDNAIKLFTETDNKTIFRPNLNAALTLASRIYLYQSEYQKVLDVTDLALNNGVELFSLSNEQGYFLDYGNTEILFSWGYFNYPGLYDERYRFIYEMSEALDKLYLDEDWRKEAFYKKNKNSPIPYKWNKDNDMFSYALRTSEIYLNRAEAFANTNNKGKVKELMDKYKVYRYLTVNSVDYSNDAEAIAEVKKERRLEFAFEFHRWFDLRRYGMEAISHEYVSEGEKEIFLIEKNSNRFVLPFPQEAIKRNTALKQNPR